MAHDYFELEVRLAAEQATERISSVLDENGLLVGLTGDKPLVGKIKGNEFCVWRRTYYRNSWRATLCGSFKPSNSGCVICGRFRFHPFVRPFTIIFLGMVFIVLVIGIMKIYLEWMKGSFDPITLLVVLVPLVAMISFIYATIWNKRQWKDDEEFMREIIKDLFKDTLVNT